MLHTTFNLLRLAGACGQEVGCGQGYDKLATHLGGTKAYGKDTRIPLTVILESNGLNDTLWCLRAVLPGEKAQRDREARLLACDYAEHVLPLYEIAYPQDSRIRDCIAVSRRYAVGEATKEELKAAWAAAVAARAAWAAARAAWAAGAAARAAAAAAAAGAAWAAAGAAAGAAETGWQAERFRAMLAS